MREAHDVAQVRAAEAALMAALPHGALMERAAAGLASTVIELVGGAYGLRVVLLVGSGDNGGDALLAGALLARRGARVDAVLVSSSRHHHVATLQAAGGRVHVVGEDVDVDALDDVTWWARADVVIDGILGIGGRGGLRAPATELVDLIPVDALVVAVDLPSGVDADSGELPGDAVVADVTVCMGTYKPALLVDPAAALAGEVVLVDIALTELLPASTVEALQVDDVLPLLPWPDRDTDKYRRGAVGVVAGSARYPGAAVLSVAGAVGGGAGYVRCICETQVIDAVRGRFPDVVCTDLDSEGGSVDDVRAKVAQAGRVQAYVFGPGSGVDASAATVLEVMLGTDAPLLIDADGITLLAESPDLLEVLRSRRAPALLTPHAGELARLLGAERPDVEARRLHHVRRAADDLGATVLLKGSTTLVADPHRAQVRANPTGTPWLGTAGSGDVLSGLAGAYLASGLDAFDAASVAAFLHGVAGQMASEGGLAPVRALDVAAALPGAVAALREHLG